MSGWLKKESRGTFLTKQSFLDHLQVDPFLLSTAKRTPVQPKTPFWKIVNVRIWTISIEGILKESPVLQQQATRSMCIINENAPEKKKAEDAQGPNMVQVILRAVSLLFLRVHTTKYFINISGNPENLTLH